MKSKCLICFLQLKIDCETSVTACLHVFHPRCLAMWLSKSKTCPKCRTPVTAETVRHLYLEPLLDAPSKTIPAKNMERFIVLEECVYNLIEEGGKNGILSAAKLIEVLKIRRNDLDVLIDAFPGVLIQYDKNGKEGELDEDGRVISENKEGAGRDENSKQKSNSRLHVVELAPVFALCRLHETARAGCTDVKCRKMHICKEMLLLYGDDCGRVSCRRCHKFIMDEHNLRVMRKELEFDPLEAPTFMVQQIVTFSIHKHTKSRSSIDTMTEAETKEKGKKNNLKTKKAAKMNSKKKMRCK